jgi:hypothetical protein
LLTQKETIDPAVKKEDERDRENKPSIRFVWMNGCAKNRRWQGEEKQGQSFGLDFFSPAREETGEDSHFSRENKRRSHGVEAFF